MDRIASVTGATFATHAHHIGSHEQCEKSSGQIFKSVGKILATEKIMIVTRPFFHLAPLPAFHSGTNAFILYVGLTRTIYSVYSTFCTGFYIKYTVIYGAYMVIMNPTYTRVKQIERNERERR